MNRVLTGLALLACGASSAAADIDGVQLGSLAPPGTIGGKPVFASPFDSRIFSDVLSAPDAFGRSIVFGHAVSCRQIGLGWATWSHGWTGNCYYTNGRTEMTVLFPRGTKAAYLYAEPGPFGQFPFTVSATDGVTTISFTEPVEGFAGAAGWAFHTGPGRDVVAVTVASIVDFSIGEFGISAPCPADLDVDGFVDFTDFLLFLNYYDAADQRVDFTGDGLVDFSDYLEFLNFYGNSCEND